MRIYAARHGQTEWNALNKVCGRTDSMLTDRGREQARELAASLADKKVDLILVSPLTRARETAAAVAAVTGAEMITDNRLIEQDYGIYEGVDRKDPGFLGNKKQFAVRYPGGESMMDVAARVYGLLDEIKVKYADKTVLLVCHGGVCRVLRTYFEPLTNEEFFAYSAANCEALGITPPDGYEPIA